MLSNFRRPLPPLLLLLLALLVPAQRAAAQSQSYNSGASIPTYHPDWMRWVPDSTSLAALSLPGTHDTMANDTEWYVSGVERSWVLAQSVELRPQLDAGIRVLDIRARHVGDRFTMHHGAYYLRANFDDVLATAVQFLRERPSETLLMRIKQEHSEENSTRSFAATFDWYRNASAYSSFIWRQSYIPSLGEVRGKIVILDDFSNGQYGIPWSSLNLQDVWDASNPGSKWELVRNQLTASNGGAPNAMYVNFLSASSFFYYNPSDFAQSVNASTLNYLAAGNVQRTGVMMMDFPGAALIDTLVTRNSPYIPYTLPLRGGSGGAPTSSECPPGAVAVGVHGRAGQYIDRLGLVCRYVNSDGSLGSYHYASAQGGDGGSYFERTCFSGMVIVGFHGRSGAYVDGLGMHCARPATWNIGYGVDSSPWLAGGNGGASFSDLCRNGSMVTRLRLRTWSLVDQMQPLCARLQ
ncbi:phosphatidylinositol-specific phospholipase C domain-containing protein [Pyxidicoccus fallax]|uniref:1-phosphatidylinositol phosphodiesterase n=1 Tax=Pyxidicoccus fallax TaxID=394095 RepID=A0A848LN32_9BACT|nr:phosphatidylinositol-specific phospholipase C domain-containing protein [Pyxidicoccus fallax]NMO19255.1 phosphatidylinositol-specific phospholipase C domain-containing protein [Pyxidicoccus fallax]NPC79826.1 phosphatidylinositol-specific phospholipase C domain-containing protein [Pyxidicoccus fallax]